MIALSFMPLWTSLSFSLPLISTADDAVAAFGARCSVRLPDLLHLATQRLCSALSLWGSSPPLFSPAAAAAAAVGLGIKIRHFIVSKFCEADNIAAPIAAAAASGEREEPFGVGFATA